MSRAACIFVALLAVSLAGSAVAADPGTQLRLPAPTGPHAVGTRTFELETGRLEGMTPDPDDRRRIVVQLWYPAEPGGECRPAPYMDARTSESVADGLPADFGTRVRHDGCLDAPFAAPEQGRERGRWPVVLHSHGLGATRFSSTGLVEELASHGTVVAAVQHPYGSRLTLFADGTAAAFDEEQWGTLEAIEANLPVWVADARAVLDRLAELDGAATGELAGRLALDRVGYVGHSFGGAAAFAAARVDPRFAAIADLDGRLPPSQPRPLRLGVPLLVLLNGESDRRDEFGPGPDLYLARIAGSSHASFTDSPLMVGAFAPAAASPSAGALEPATALELVRRAVESFFACALRGETKRCDELRARLAAAGW